MYVIKDILPRLKRKEVAEIIFRKLADMFIQLEGKAKPGSKL